MVNLDETILSRIVNGFRKPAPEVKAKIAAALNSNQDWLFEEVEAERLTPRSTEAS
jgi:transcriptional regulator with XRE-family HTH domain